MEVPPERRPAQNDPDQTLLDLYRDYAAQLLRYATATTGNPEEARDAVQEVFLRYFIERRFGREVESPRAWLYQVLRNYLVARSRTAAKSRETTAEHLELLPDRRPGPDANLRRSEIARELTSILSSRELDCLRLRGEGLSYVEIGNVLGISTGTVGALLSRVYRKLRPADKESVVGVADALQFLFLEVGHDSP